MQSTLVRNLGIVAAVAILAVFTVLAARERQPATSPLAGTTVAATIFPLADIARQIGGEHLGVVLLIPPGVSEHSQALSPQQLQEVQRAQIIFQIGHGLDDGLTGRLAQAFPALRLVTVDRGISVREFGEEEQEDHEKEGHEDEATEAEEDHDHDSGIDPHYWLTVPNAMKIAATMTQSLAEMDPEHAASYQRNFTAYQEQLANLEEELQEAAHAIPRKEFIAMHNAWSYWADHYGFRLVATYEPVAGRDPSLADLQRLQAIIAQYNLTTFFAEPQKLSSTVTNFVERELGLKVLILDPVGGLPETNSYIELMRFNMRSLAEGAR
ncbi:MAG: metal ABC transporter substrate-binding protein [Candidatus Andersenbacteria bacterium]